MKAKLEMAKFLQDTVEESAMVKSGSGKHPELAKEFQSLLVEVNNWYHKFGIIWYSLTCKIIYY